MFLVTIAQYDTKYLKNPEKQYMAPKKSETKNIDKTTNIEPGMVVEATQGDLGEEDVSKPKVTEVVQDQQGKVDKLIVQKGVIFRKTLEIPADRVQSIDQENIEDESTPGKVVVEVGEKEAEIADGGWGRSTRILNSNTIYSTGWRKKFQQ